MTQLLDRLPRLQAEHLGEPDRRPPELAVGVDDDAAALVRHRADVPEDRLQVERERDEVGEDDVVELLVPDESLARLGDELELGVARAMRARPSPG